MFERIGIDVVADTVDIVAEPLVVEKVFHQIDCYKDLPVIRVRIVDCEQIRDVFGYFVHDQPLEYYFQRSRRHRVKMDENLDWTMILLEKNCAFGD